MTSTEDYVRWESIDRFRVNSPATKAFLKSQNKWQLKRRQTTYWFICFSIGIVTGLIEFINFEGLSLIQGTRLSISSYILQNYNSIFGFFGAWAIYTFGAVISVVTGCICTIYIAPMSRGGGIPEIKAFLNGIKVPGLLGLKTCLIKMFATMTSVGGGLCCGQEGPMVHIASCVAYNLSQMKYKKFPRLSRIFKKFQNDQDRRDFVTTGSSAGVASAFRSPIGGTLFGLEEAASFWSHDLIARTFFSCMLATLFTNFFIGGGSEGFWHFINHPAHTLYYVPAGNGFRFWELIPFCVVAIIGGLLGALWIKIAILINQFRRQFFYKKNINKIIDLAIIALITATLSILLPYILPCKENSLLDPDPNLLPDTEKGIKEEPQIFEKFTCPTGYYSPMASLWFTNTEIGLKHLYIRSTPHAFGLLELGLFFLCYYLLAACTVGTWISAGVLVPQLVIGASFGRFIGTFINNIIGIEVDPGMYALLGSSAFLGGVSRRTISLGVIIVEISNDLDLLLPIMLVITIGKWIGDLFTLSLYDEQIHLNKIPYLEQDPPKLARVMSSKEAMVDDVISVAEVDTVQNLLDAVKSSNLYDVIAVINRGIDEKKMFLKGSIPRNHLNILLQERAFDPRRGLINVLDIYPKEPDFLFTEEELGMTLDLRPYINLATFSVLEDFPLHQAYKIFRYLGLKELFVVNYQNELVGILTRNELASHELKTNKLNKKSKKGIINNGIPLHNLNSSNIPLTNLLPKANNNEESQTSSLIQHNSKNESEETVV